MKKEIFRLKEDTFESSVKELDVAYDRMFNNYSQYLRYYLQDIESYRRIEGPHDENSYYETSDRPFAIDDRLYEGISQILERNKNKHFESYKSIANDFLLFMRNNWEEQYLQQLDSPLISNSIRYLYNQFDVVVDAFQDMPCDVDSLIESYAILNYYSNAFSLACLYGKTYNLQRSLLKRALNVINYDPLDLYSFPLDLLIDVFKSKDKIRLRDLSRFLFILTSKRHVKKTKPSLDLSEGALKAELAYYLFEESKSKEIRRTIGIKSTSLSIYGETIDGDFELPLRTMGYLAESNNVRYLAFRGSKCFKNWITNLHQLLIGPKTAYMCSLGLLLELIDSDPEKQIIVCGHSLGGGLSQFAVAAATAAGYKNIKAYGYNSAGFSDETMDIINHISGKRIEFSNIFHICHISDVVSRIGYILGDCYLIGKRSQVLSHKLDTIISELDLTNRLVLVSKVI